MKNIETKELAVRRETKAPPWEPTAEPIEHIMVDAWGEEASIISKAVDDIVSMWNEPDNAE